MSSECSCWWKTLLWWGVVPTCLWLLFKYFSRKLLAKYWGVANLEWVNFRGKVAIVTGAGSGLGFETAVELANRGATVLVTGRTLKSAKKTIIAIRNRTFLGTLVPAKLELASLESVTKFCVAFENQFEQGLDLLVNNAGVFMPVEKREKSMDGFEIHLAVNHLSHFLLTNLLLPSLKKKPSRIVTVTSLIHRGSSMNFDDLMYEKTEIKDLSMLGNCLYKQSKLANILFVQELRNRLKNSGSSNVKAFSVCPGIVKTKISRNFAMPWFADIIMPLIEFFVFKTPSQGAQTILHCGLSEDVDENNCILYRHCKPWNQNDRSFPEDFFISHVSTNYSQEVARKLWTESEKLVGKTFN